MSEKPFYSLHDSTGYWVTRLGMAMREAFVREISKYDVTPPQWAILITCHNREADTPAELARHLGVDNAAITRLLDHLETKGLLTRRPHGLDRRCVTLHLTPAGQDLAPRLAKVCQEINRRFLSALTPQEAERFASCLKKMIQQVPPGMGSCLAEIDCEK